MALRNLRTAREVGQLIYVTPPDRRALLRLVLREVDELAPFQDAPMRRMARLARKLADPPRVRL